MNATEIYQTTLDLAKRQFDALSRAQQMAIHHAWTDRDGSLRVDSSVCRINTRNALERLGIVQVGSYALTDLGRLLFAAQS
jgi:hypothetical protein